MTQTPSQSPHGGMVRPIVADDPFAVADALHDALTGAGPAIAPVPPEGEEHRRTLEVCAPADPLEVPAAALVATSGSTGTPKGVLLDAAAITTGAHATHQVLGGPGTWHLAVPAHYVAGLMVIARTLVAGTELVPARSDLADLRARRGVRNYLSVVPTQLRRARQDADLVRRLVEFDALLLGGAPAAADELAWWQARGARVVTSYGMSETSGGCVYDGRPLPGVDVTLDDDGRVLIGAPMVFSGYRLRPDLTAEVLSVGADGTRTLRTNDRARWRDGRLQILGRVDDVVISGGVNVDLAAVERIVQQVTGDPGLAAVGIPDPEWGTLVAVVGPQAPALAELRTLLAPHLGRAALPRAVGRFGLPLTSGGKINRREIIRRWAELPGREQL